ncbi:MAG: hypothetical protein AB8B50_10145 [Pirellulaceae bacterium]
MLSALELAVEGQQELPRQTRTGFIARTSILSRVLLTRYAKWWGDASKGAILQEPARFLRPPLCKKLLSRMGCKLPAEECRQAAAEYSTGKSAGPGGD